MREKIKLKLPKAVEDFFQVYGKKINGNYLYFPNFYKQTDNGEYEELTFDELPEGFRKFIENQRNVKIN